MSNPESRRLERVATAIRMAMQKDYSHLSEPERSREIARRVLKVIMRPRPGEPVAWQARIKNRTEEDADWFQVEYPDQHNNPEIYEYRPLYAFPIAD